MIKQLSKIMNIICISEKKKYYSNILYYFKLTEDNIFFFTQTLSLNQLYHLISNNYQIQE